MGRHQYTIVRDWPSPVYNPQAMSDISNSSNCQKSSARNHILNMETVLGQIRTFFIIIDMIIRNKPRIVRRIVEFFFFFSEISASISLIKNKRRGITNSWKSSDEKLPH